LIQQIIETRLDVGGVQVGIEELRGERRGISNYLYRVQIVCLWCSNGDGVNKSFEMEVLDVAHA